MIRSTDPSKKVSKIPPKFHDKAVQSNILWLNLNKMSGISILWLANKVTPHFTFMRRAENADTHALKQPRLSRNISPAGSSFVLVIASNMHLEPESEKRWLSHSLKISRYTQHLIAIFRRIPIKLTSDLFTLVWPHAQKEITFSFNLRALELGYTCVSIVSFATERNTAQALT